MVMSSYFVARAQRSLQRVPCSLLGLSQPPWRKSRVGGLSASSLLSCCSGTGSLRSRRGPYRTPHENPDLGPFSSESLDL